MVDGAVYKGWRVLWKVLWLLLEESRFFLSQVEGPLYAGVLVLYGPQQAR
jgi:hypothetical protein